MIAIKRIYEKPDKDDGYRILVDRLWPRGISKERAKVDLWLKEIAPGNELRKQFHHGSLNWEDFKRNYTEELKEKKDLISEINTYEKDHKTITLLYGSKDILHNQAVVLKEVLSHT